jgi:hypothetical protein
MPEVTEFFYPQLKRVCLVDNTTPDYVLNWLFDEIHLARDFSSNMFDVFIHDVKRWGLVDTDSQDFGVKRTPYSVFLFGQVKEWVKAIVPEATILDATTNQVVTEEKMRLERQGLLLSFECKQLLTEPINRVKVTGLCATDDIWPGLSIHFDALWERFSKEFGAVAIDEPNQFPDDKLLESVKATLPKGQDIRAAKRRERVKELSQAGWKVDQIASNLGVSIPTVTRDRQALGIATPRKDKSNK